MFQGLLAALFMAINDIAAKKILSRKFGVNKFNVMQFLMVSLLMIPLLPFLFRLPESFFSPYYLFLVFGMVICCVLLNILYYRGMEHEPLEQVEPIIQLTPLFTILLAFLFFPEERSMMMLLLSCIAVGALIILRLKNGRVVWSKYTSLLVGAAFIWAIHLVFIKELLMILNPFTVVLLRSAGSTLILVPLYKIERFDLYDHRLAPMIIFGLLTVLENVTRFWAYESIGLIRASLLLCLAPLIAIWGSHLINGEIVHKKNIVVTVIILLCVAASLFI